jgi:signal recognition particle subunit SRP54
LGVPGAGSYGAGGADDPMAGFDPDNLPKGFEKFLGR